MPPVPSLAIGITGTSDRGPASPRARRHRGRGVELRAMRREPSRMPEVAPPVACVGCGSDAFALGVAVETVGGLDVELRCGACGTWQRRRLTLADADRFLDHMALTQAAIARALTAA
jgi:hypothetical protein